MGSFEANLAWRIALMALAITLAVLGVLNHEFGYGIGVLFAILAIYMAFNLYRYVNDTNRRLSRLFESVRYSDFAIRFSNPVEKGASFSEVNRRFNEVLEAFRQTRAEKEANLLFLNTMVQQLSTGLLAFDAEWRVLVSNSSAFQQLGIYRLNMLDDLPKTHQPLIDFVRTLTGRSKMLYQADSSRQLSVQGVRLNLQGRAVHFITIQNIHPELQRKEVNAWRNLTRVLRHEMMNSITPIVSLIETMQEIVEHDLPQSPATADLTEALDVVATRSRGLINFVEAYRSFTAIPAPKLEEIQVKKLLERVASLSASDLKNQQVRIEFLVQPENMTIQADSGQLEMTLINLLKNAREAFSSVKINPANPVECLISVSAGIDSRNHPFIEVADNGPGISAELMEEIFIPFFTTKPEGTGVGLSISRQIMQQHGGDLRVSSEPGTGTKFTLEF